MDWSRVKTILIVFLSLLNGVLALVLLTNHNNTYAERQRFTQNLIEILKESNVAAEPEMITTETEYVYDIVRSGEKEKKCVSVFLGDAEAVDMGGNIVMYENDNGTAYFRSGGVFDIRLNTPIDLTDAEAQIVDLARKMGLLQAKETPNIDMTENSAMLYASWGNYPVWGSYVNFSIEDDKLKSISGKWLFGDAERRTDTPCKTAAAALLALADYLKSGGEESYAVVSVELGFFGESMPTAVRITPFWKIEINKSVYYINAITNRLQTKDAVIPTVG